MEKYLRLIELILEIIFLSRFITKKCLGQVEEQEQTTEEEDSQELNSHHTEGGESSDEHLLDHH